MMLLETANIRLRALEPEDLDVLYRWENDPALWEVGNTLAPYSRYILKEYIANSHQSIYESCQLRMMIESCNEREALGLVDLFDYEPRHSRAACGILLDSGCRGKGIATEAIRLMMEYAFSHIRLHQLYAHVPEKNEPSKRLFARCGFVDAGVLRDWITTQDGYSDVRIMQAIKG